MAFACPHCKRGLSLKHAKPGRYTPKCPKCGQHFALTVFPQPDQSPAVALLPNESSAATLASPSTAASSTAPAADGYRLASEALPQSYTKASSIAPAADGYQLASDALPPPLNKAPSTAPTPPDTWTTLTDQPARVPSRQPRELAADIFKQLASAVDAQLPVGCRADTDKCISMIESLVTGGTNPEQVVTAFATAFRNSPAAYVDHPHVYLAYRAAQVFWEIEPHLSKGLPAGSCLKPAECKTLLQSLLAAGTSEESLIDTFIARIRGDSTRYLSGVALPSPREIAETVYGQLAHQFVLPPGCTPNRSTCISAIEALVKANTSPSDLLNSFMKVVAASPEFFLNGRMPDYRYSRASFSSDAPRSMGRSEIR